jgi:hypothetical protein
MADAKRILGWLQETVVTEQLSMHCETVRPCPVCHRRRHLKDRNRRRRLDTVLGKVTVEAPRFDGCRRCRQRRIVSPLSDLLPDRVTPELRHLQVKLAAQYSYRRAAQHSARVSAQDRRPQPNPRGGANETIERG